MKSTALALGLLVFDAHLAAMNHHPSEAEPLIAYQARQLSNTRLSSNSSFQLPSSTRTIPLQASKPLHEMLAMRSPEFEPLFAQDVRAKNMKLLETMGGQDAQSGILKGVIAVSALNLIKQGVALGLWGFHNNNDFLNLIPINHLMNLLPACTEICWETCNPQSCHVICSSSGYCPDLWQLNTITYPLLGTGMVNTGLIVGALTKLITNSWDKENTKKQFIEILQKLDELTMNQSDESENEEQAAHSKRLLEMLNQQVAMELAQKDEKIPEDERQKKISLIQLIGKLKTSTKLYAFLGLVCGLNLVNDTVISSLWGLDTKYPSNATNATNQTACKNVCVPIGCCTELCGGWDCFCRNSTVCPHDQTSVPNNIGIAHTAGMLANFVVGLGSWYLASSSYKQAKTHEVVMQKYLKQLDSLSLHENNAVLLERDREEV